MEVCRECGNVLHRNWVAQPACVASPSEITVELFVLRTGIGVSPLKQPTIKQDSLGLGFNQMLTACDFSGCAQKRDLHSLCFSQRNGNREIGSLNSGRNCVNSVRLPPQLKQATGCCHDKQSFSKRANCDSFGRIGRKICRPQHVPFEIHPVDARFQSQRCDTPTIG